MESLLKKYDRIVFAGDSIMDCGRRKPEGESFGEGTAPALGNGFVYLLHGYLHMIYPEEHYRLINKGSNGNTSKDLLNRFDEDILSVNPNVIFIMIGVNDVWRIYDSPDAFEIHHTVQDYYHNLEEMILKAQKASSKVILLSPFFAEANEEDFMKKEIRERINAMKDIANKYSLLFIDIQNAIDEALKKTNSYALTKDRIHPNVTGQMIIVREIIKHL